MMKKIILTLTIIGMSLSFASAQSNYNTGIGFRGGLSNGLTIKHFLDSETALEGLASFRWSGYHITGLYEKHAPAFDVLGFNWYYGVGGHIGFWDGDDNPWFDDNQSYTVVGVDGIIGLEYTFEEIPINLSVDWKPAFNLAGDTGFWGDDAGFSVRFVF